MIDLSKIGYNVLEKDGHLEVTGGLTLTVKVGISSLAPDKEAMIEHAQRRILEKIWEMVYGHLDDPVEFLRRAINEADHSCNGMGNILERMAKLEKAIGEP